jgi:putative hydrolase
LTNRAPSLRVLWNMASVRAGRDLNWIAASALLDFGIAHSGKHARIAYRRAARAILALERPIDEVAQDEGGLRSVRSIGPSTERILLEVIEKGESPTLERAIAHENAGAEVAAARRLRSHFLSRAEVARVLAAKTPGVIRREDYRGDLQMHTRWSDGGESIEAMARAAGQRGYAYIGVTDHSYGLHIAHGISMADVERQQREIDELNRRSPVRVIKSIESNIRPDGSIDMEPDELRQFEIVLAAPHSSLRKADDQTERMLAAVRHPQVHVLAHPRGRMVTRRGVLARWDDVFAEAARTRTAIELDGDPWRQDLDWTLARHALAAGCLFAIDSDAHAGDELEYSEIGLAHARLAGIPAERVINAWPIERLLAWAEERSSGRRLRRSA